MKAIIVREFGNPDVMKIETLTDLEPDRGQVLVSLKAVGVNPVETYIRSGNYARKPDLPFTPGRDGAGIVKAIGPGVTTVKEGDRVYLSGTMTGTYAEETLCKAEDVHLLPDEASFEAGACLGIPYSTAYRALFQKAQALPGEWVLIQGATGGVGTAALQLAAARGIAVIATGGSEQGRKLAKEQGADEVLDHHSANYLDAVDKITGGHGVDVILETTAHINLGKDLKILADNGRVIVIGNRGDVSIDPRNAMEKEASILGVMLSRATDAEKKEMHAALYAGLRNKTLNPVIREVLPLEQAPKAHIKVLESGSAGNIILRSWY